MRTIRYLAKANEEFFSTFDGYSKIDEHLATRFKNALAEAETRILQFPKLGSEVRFVEFPPPFTIRRVPIVGFPYHLVYLEGLDQGNEILVLSVPDMKRRPFYWSSRLTEM